MAPADTSTVVGGIAAFLILVWALGLVFELVVLPLRDRDDEPGDYA